MRSDRPPRLSGSIHLCLSAVLALAYAHVACAAAETRPHPRVLLTPAEVAAMREALGAYPLFDAAVGDARRRVEAALAAPIDVPVPRDAAGYTHERHKQNYTEMQLAGVLFQLTGDARYAALVKELLLKYAGLYPSLGPHPASRGSSPGRLFWQSLNETVWLVHVAQAYDCVHAALTPDERDRIESQLLRPMTRWLLEERTRDFDRIHNHGTWTTTAVGLAGIALGDEALVQQALRGSRLDGSGGYLRQLDELFSPDGFYCEGPYYARYALLPFLLFARAIENHQPELQIFARRDGVLRRTVHATLQQTAAGGAFIPFNDALKEKTFLTPEMVFAVDLMFALHPGEDAPLLSIAQRQNAVALNAAGLAVARALAASASGAAPPPYPYASVELRDGPTGETGGIGLLRSGPGVDDSLAVLKYTAFGMEHGHFDKLALIYYDQGREILPDYGAARFLNIEQKFGGRYLPENNSFAKQTIAHNTVVVDERSHYGGEYRAGEHAHAERHFFDVSDPDFQVMSARDTTAVPGVAMQRTIALVRDAQLDHPIVIDVFRLTAAAAHQYDLPFYFQGHFLQTNVALTAHTAQRRALGASHGYQHVWLEAESAARAAGLDRIAFTWLNGRRFYTITSAGAPDLQVLFARVGANDPQFNLRPETALILRRRSAADHVFATVIEPHGSWDPTLEVTAGNAPKIHEVRVRASTRDGTAVEITGENGLLWTLLISNRDHPTSETGHTIATNTGETLTWRGPAELIRRGQTSAPTVAISCTTFACTSHAAPPACAVVVSSLRRRPHERPASRPARRSSRDVESEQ